MTSCVRRLKSQEIGSKASFRGFPVRATAAQTEKEKIYEEAIA
jgi:hypothetical protein